MQQEEPTVTGITALSGTVPAVAPARVPAQAMNGGFALPAAAVAPPGPGAASALAPAAALAGLLALQEAGPEAVRDRAARRHGRAMLAALAGVQLALLAGADGGDGTGSGGTAPAAAVLERLATLLDGMPPAEDPALAAVLGAVALRCRIEIARRP